MAGKRGRKKGTYTRKRKPALILNNEEAGPSNSSKNNREKTAGRYSRSDSGSPIRGFAPEEIPPLPVSATDERKPPAHNSQDELPNFDKLIDPNYKSRFSDSRKIRTYVNKSRKKALVEQQELLEFQNDSTRDSIIKWLNDNKNTFDRLTQTQCDCCEETYPSLDFPSVSQKPRPYNLRPRYSLEIKPQRTDKSSKKGIAGRHSLAGDTPGMENYHIEDYYSDEEDISAIPAQVDTTNAKFLINLMEDEYLASLQQEINEKILAEKEMNSWDRFKHVDDSRKRAKKLEINTKSPPNESRSYNCVEVEEYISKNMKKMLEPENANCYETILSENAEVLLTNLLNLKKEDISSDFKAILLLLQATISEFVTIHHPSTCSISTQTDFIIHKTDKHSQTVIETRIASNQTEKMEEDKKNASTQVVLQQNSVETQTEKQFFSNELELNVKEPSNVVNGDSLDDVFFDTEELLNNCEENVENKPISGSVLELSPPEAVQAVNFPKRLRSPGKNDEIKAKRPCNKFVNDDLSIDFDSCAQNDKVIVLSDSEEILQNVEFREGGRTEQPRSRTQELIEECDLLIYNATKPQKQQASPRREETSTNLVNLESEDEKQPDLDYFETNPTPKSRKSLFGGKQNRGKSPLKDISFATGNNNNKELEEDNFERLINQISTPTLAQPPENIVLREAHCFNEEDEEEDIIETTPQKPPSFPKNREFVASLPPPLEFQDLESLEQDITLIPGTPPSPSKKITSTQLSNRPNSELISMSAILSDSEDALIKPITLIQKKLPTPSSLGRTPQRAKPKPSQKSILNYLNKSLESSPSQERKPCIACSRLSKDQVLRITCLANKKLATFSSTFSGKVTHMIVSTNEKNWTKDHTMKYVSAVAAGIWILNYKWVERCISSGGLVDEEEFEVLDVTGVEGPKKSRLNRLTSPLFRGYRIHVAPPFSSTTREEVERVIELMGGRVVATPDDLLEKNKIRLIITEAKATEDYDVYESWLEALQVITVDLEWLSRSVGEYKLIPFQPFVLCSEDNLEGLDYPPELLLPSAF